MCLKYFPNNPFIVTKNFTGHPLASLINYYYRAFQKAEANVPS